MPFMFEKTREDNHTREKYDFVKNLFSIFSKVHLKSTCSQNFQYMTLSAFKQLEWNKKTKVERFSLDPLELVLGLELSAQTHRWACAWGACLGCARCVSLMDKMRRHAIIY